MSKQLTEACEFVRSTRVEERLRVVPSGNYSGQEILELLEAGRVDVSGDSLLLRNEPGSCCEGQVVLGKVLANERQEHPKTWRKLGASKTRERASRGKKQAQATNKPVAVVAEEGGAGHNKHCCQIGGPEHLLFQAGQLRWNAERLLQCPNPDTGAVTTALKTARNLLEAADGLSSEEAMWLMAAEAMLEDKKGNHAEAASRLSMASLTAAMDLGCDHPTTVILLGNEAQYKIEHGDASAKADLAKVIERLKSGRIKPIGNCTQEWLDGGIAEFSTTLAKADELIAKWNQSQPGYRPPVAEAVCDAEAEFPELMLQMADVVQPTRVEE